MALWLNFFRDIKLTKIPLKSIKEEKLRSGYR